MHDPDAGHPPDDPAIARAGAGGRAAHPGYRPDIDGLRALAVAPVVLFHAGVRGFSGGFVGVDIFFVISGYLITGILARELATGRYSIAQFYRRRVLRIFPALGAMLLATTAAACALLLPAEIGRFAESLGGTALFASNIAFYARTDYFNAGAVSQPLLHTWSLAVEEQWYLVWPLLLAAIGPGRRRLALAVTLGLSLASLASAAWLLPRNPDATFYLLPTRAWELGAGAALALAPLRVPSRRVGEAMGLVGLILIAASVKLYTKDTAFPGVAAVPPCLGALLLIEGGRAGGRVARLLGAPPLHGLGLISYSLYLWHWPIIVFAEIGLFVPAGAVTTLLLLATMLAAAFLSWRFVEQPFRHGVAGWRTSAVLVVAGGAMAAILALALATPALNRVARRASPQETALGAWLGFDGDAAYRRGLCFKVGPRGTYDAARCLAASGTRPAVLVVGDSHAAHLWPGLARHRDRLDILQATATGCVAKRYPLGTRDCAVVDGALRGWLAAHRPAALILASRWERRWIVGLEETLRDPEVHAAHPVLVGPLPTYSTGLPRLLVAAGRRHDPGLIVRAENDEPFALDPELRAIAARTGTRYVSLIDLLCRRRVCRTLAAPGVPLQFDDSHLTPAGSAIVADAILARIGAAR